jgi:hypothetical protein
MKKVNTDVVAALGKYEYTGEDGSHMHMDEDGELNSLEKGDVVELSSQAAEAFKDRFRPWKEPVKKVAPSKESGEGGEGKPGAGAGAGVQGPGSKVG